MQRGLPAKGSQILPYKRLIIEADWVDSRSPLKRVPFTSTLVNRHDNGVVSEQSVTTAGDSAVTWAYFRTYYRMADLRSQELWGDSQIGMANLKDSTAIRATPQTLVKGAEFDMSVPQPSRKGEKRMQCRVGHKTGVRRVCFAHRLRSRNPLLSSDAERIRRGVRRRLAH